jgi:hypothetical protein
VTVGEGFRVLCSRSSAGNEGGASSGVVWARVPRVPLPSQSPSSFVHTQLRFPAPGREGMHVSPQKSLARSQQAAEKKIQLFFYR